MATTTTTAVKYQTNPTLNVKSTTALSASELDQIQTWNSRVELRSVERCVHDVVVEKSQAAPSAEAIAAWDGTLTYSELDALSTTLANRLFELGHGQEQFIGLLFDKSKWTAVSSLAVMKAGSAFFLIDTSLPDQRIRRMCEIAQASVIITSAGLSTRACQLERPVLVAEHESQGTVATLNSLPTVSPRNAVYVAFTSGSTGDPKAVVIEHRAVCSGMPSYSLRMGLTRQSRMFQFASYSFVISILDHLGALMNGACLCVPSVEQIQNSLASTITELNANWVEITPSVARGLEPRGVPTLKTVVLTGEAATSSDLDTWKGDVDLKTCYGQSENSLGALVHNKTSSSRAGDMGYPWAARCWVVNRDSDDLVPIGAEGELWLEGPSLARGYLNDDEQTAAVFIENPTWMEKIRAGERARFLKTGDLVRYRSELGLLQYVGRRGTQVKLRGQRIELAEVEGQLKKQFPRADTAIAEIVNPSHDGNGAILVAFIPVHNGRAHGDAADGLLFADTTAEFSAQSQTALAQLQETLPKYMIPATVVPLATLPLTASGKLNRKLLRSKACELGPRLQTYHLLMEKTHRPARTENEIVIRGMCADILRSAAEDINMDASFFELGGNSITTMWLVSRAREAGFAFTTTNVFQQMSLAELAGSHGGIGSARSTGAEATSESSLSLTGAQKEELMKLIPSGIDPSNISDLFPCTQIQQWQLDHHEGGHFLFRFFGTLQVDRLHIACRRLVQTHSSLRSLFTSHDGMFFQVVLENIVDVPFITHHNNSTRDPISFARDLCAIDPTVDPQQVLPADVLPLQFTLVPDSSDQEHVLILRLSHAQYDGICQQTLISDLCKFYQHPSHAGSPTDFAAYAHQVARQQMPDTFSFWKKLLAGSKLTNLPTPPQHPSEKAVRLHCTTTIPIPETPLPSGITLATVVKAAWSHVLRQATGSEDIVFAEFVALRDLEDIPQAHRLVGMCVNQCPVRVNYSSSNNKPIKTVLDLLHAVQAQHTQSLPFKVAEWDNLVSKSTDWSEGSQPQSIVMHLNYDIEKEFDLGGGLRCELADYLSIELPFNCIEVYSEPRKGGAELGIELVSSTMVVEEEGLEVLMGELGRKLGDFMANPGRVLG